MKVELDRERRLRYNLAAMEDIEERLGINIMAGEAVGFTKLDDITWLLWLGLYHAGEKPDISGLPWWKRLGIALGLVAEPELTQDVVAEWIDMRDLPVVTNALSEAFGGDEIQEAQEIAAGNPTRKKGKSVKL